MFEKLLCAKSVSNSLTPSQSPAAGEGWRYRVDRNFVPQPQWANLRAGAKLNLALERRERCFR